MALTTIKAAAMAANSVDSDQYVDGSVDTAHIGNLQVTNAKLADDAVGADELAADAVVNASIASSAAIAHSKLANVTDGQILVGNGSNVPTAVAVSGDVTIANTGAVTIAAGAVETGMIAADAVDGTKIGDDSIDSEHYVDGSIDEAHLSTSARNIPENAKTTNYTLIAADAGKHIKFTPGDASQTLTVPDSVFASGDAITIVNNSGNNLAIAKGTNMYYAADATNANRTLAGRGVATLLFIAADTCYITGAGLS